MSFPKGFWITLKKLCLKTSLGLLGSIVTSMISFPPLEITLKKLKASTTFTAINVTSISIVLTLFRTEFVSSSLPVWGCQGLLTSINTIWPSTLTIICGTHHCSQLLRQASIWNTLCSLVCCMLELIKIYWPPTSHLN